MRVLLIDDDPTQRKLVRAWIEPMGLAVTVADSVISGLEAVASHDDLCVVLCDWHMHPFSGLAFVGAIRSEPGLAELPIIMLTSEDQPDRVAQAARKGVNGYILKPLMRRVLIDKLGELGLVEEIVPGLDGHPRIGVPNDMQMRPTVRVSASGTPGTRRLTGGEDTTTRRLRPGESS